MEKQPEMPKSPEQILAEKKEKFKNAVESMLNFQRSQKIKKSLLPHLDSFTSEELDYLLEYISYFDNQVQLMGPFSNTAREFLIENERRLKEMRNKMSPDRVQELKKILADENTN